MSSDNVARAKTLWWIACAAQAIVAGVETLAREYLSAVSAACMTVALLMLATGFTGDGPGRPFWRKIIFFILVAIAIGLVIYKIAFGD